MSKSCPSEKVNCFIVLVITSNDSMLLRLNEWSLAVYILELKKSCNIGLFIYSLM